MYVGLVDAGMAEIIATGIVIPELPDNCDVDSQAALADLEAKESDL